MNNLIEELAEQATTVEDTYPAGCNGYPTPSYSFDREKFAELIVKECLEQCIKESQLHYLGATKNTPSGPDPLEYAAYKATMQCRLNIRKHFGVK